MGVVLLVPLIIVNLFLGTKFIKEGLEAMDDKKDDKKEKSIDLDTIETKDTKSTDTKSKDKKATDESLANKEPRMDLASTLADAYSNLNDKIGSDGISKLTSDTKNLMNQQQKLAETMENIKPMMENMAPIIDQAKKMMSSFGGSK